MDPTTIVGSIGLTHGSKPRGMARDCYGRFAHSWRSGGVVAVLNDLTHTHLVSLSVSLMLRLLRSPKRCRSRPTPSLPTPFRFVQFLAPPQTSTYRKYDWGPAPPSPIPSDSALPNQSLAPSQLSPRLYAYSIASSPAIRTLHQPNTRGDHNPAVDRAHRRHC